MDNPRPEPNVHGDASAGLPGGAVLDQIIRRISDPGFQAWMDAVHASGCCAHPVRLSGTVSSVDPASGELRVVFSTAERPDRVLLKSCNTRRATRCPACAATYRADARTLLLAGLAPHPGNQGGDDPDDPAMGTPLLFATLTAPSYGPVHRHLDPPRRCRPAAAAPLCAHLRPQTCMVVHPVGDPAIGQAICPDCYDYQGAVIFNARAGELWHRTTIVASRRLAATAGVPVRQFGRYWRLSYAKVIEFQARGVVHVHALVRLDRQANDGNAMSLDSSDLAVALAAAAARAAVPNPLLPDRPIRWGAQIDIDPIDPEHRRRSAAYLAKYATKSVDGAGALDHRLRSGQLDRIDLPDQLRRMAATAWELGGRPELADLNLRAWAHNLGWRGHWLTKSAHWSTTFAQLRAVRRNWRLQEAGIDPEETAGWWGDWEYQGSGHLTAGDAWLADRANQSAKLNRRTAWEES